MILLSILQRKIINFNCDNTNENMKVIILILERHSKRYIFIDGKQRGY